ncbi:MAG: Smr/MutS family protein [Chloroflexota bacterium]|nr:Smr/MutS family protein [Chloroflexota bacterium]MDQ5865074.1 Smr/MutS family protein [Chloroflexota bacterium]
MNDKSLHTLEFHKVRERLASYTSFSAGKTAALELVPLTDITHVRRNQRITTEAVRLLSLRPDVTLGGARDIREMVRRAELGSVLDPSEVLMVLDTLRSCRILHGVIARTQEQRSELPTLAFIADGLTLLPKLEQEIERCISDDGQVLDSASPALGKIRVGIRAAHSRLMQRLQQLISSEAAGRALQEPIITLRNGRYVVPVKRDFQGLLKGIVHDQSNTGSTLFVEPLAVVDLGNEWRQLQLEEQQEIERILRELGGLIGDKGDSIRTNVEILADIDLALAKARYSVAIDAREPELVEPRVKGPDPSRPLDNRERRPQTQVRTSQDGQPQTPQQPEPIQNPKSKIQNPQGLYFKNARHPLLTGKVVPITVELGGRFRMLVITGPNTGGKTVALKTVGLLTLMSQAGMHIPAEGGSRAVVFKDVFADIGDEQSIEQSLSTFSSHMSNIVGILRQATRDSLVLLDELGAGTDPQEGSALARAIITTILEIGALAVCTTHYSELKAYAFSTPNVENASVEFDIQTLSPTYRLMVGVPGRSNAFAIASRLGLNPMIIDKAKRYIDPEAQRVEDLIEDIRSQREAAKSELGTAEQARREIDQRRQEVDRRLAEAEEIRARAAEEGRAQLENELETLRAELRQLRARVEAGLTATSDETLTRQWVKDAQARSEEMERQLKSKANEQKRARHRPQTSKTPRAGEPGKPHVFGPGDVVFVQSLSSEGEVLTAPDSSGQVDVQVGAFKMRVPLANLALRRTASAASAAREAASTAVARSYNTSTVPTETPRLEYDYRGWRAEEAIEDLDQRLNDAALVGMPFIRVIHGKGTGALRQAMREYLRKQPIVKEIEPAPVEQGGEGVTIVKL